MNKLNNATVALVVTGTIAFKLTMLSIIVVAMISAADSTWAQSQDNRGAVQPDHRHPGNAYPCLGDLNGG